MTSYYSEMDEVRILVIVDVPYVGLVQDLVTPGPP